jgi:hypothetical protein
LAHGAIGFATLIISGGCGGPAMAPGAMVSVRQAQGNRMSALDRNLGAAAAIPPRDGPFVCAIGSCSAVLQPRQSHTRVWARESSIACTDALRTMRGGPCDPNARARYWGDARRQDGTQYVVVHRRICPTSSSIGPFRGERAVSFSTFSYVTLDNSH